MKNFLLVIEYDGTKYHGWQRQKTDRTIQGDIESALSTMTGQNVTLIGSGRTDAGVHALAQTANFKCMTRLDAPVFLNGLNSMLGDDIAILECREMDATYHARFDATLKTYIYRFINLPVKSAVGGRYAWYIKKPLDISAMNKAASLIVGKKDFKSFEGAGSPKATTVREVFSAEFRECNDGLICFEISANGFLRFMVRNIVGTLIDVGLGKTSMEGFKEILDSADRTRAGITAPAKGLFLKDVSYQDLSSCFSSFESVGCKRRSIPFC